MEEQKMLKREGVDECEKIANTQRGSARLKHLHFFHPVRYHYECKTGQPLDHGVNELLGRCRNIDPATGSVNSCSYHEQ
jgi:hypothetical protein